MEENKTHGQIIGDLVNAPYLNSLANGGVSLGSIFGITHPSQPNYLELFSGSNQGVVDDELPPNFSTVPTGTYPFRTANLGAELIAAGFTFAGFWKGIESAGL
ncbi:MAG TPA: alkaline phosphatase family protein, partial [Verrucomicrobiae bacterium]|nr:alkaline phosphatase family protein [Verrucomicrobiae bacterium]